MAKRTSPLAKSLYPDEWMQLPVEKQSLYDRVSNPSQSFTGADPSHVYRLKTVGKIRNENYARKAGIER